VATERDVATGGRRFRRRAVAVGLALLVVAGPAAALERALGPREAPPGTTEGTASGAWFCPHGGDDGWKGWVVITNPGPAPVGVRMTGFGANGVQNVEAFSVAPGRQVYRQVGAGHPASATQIEYFRGWVGASAVLRAGGPSAPVAAARCAGAPAPAWFLPDQSTGREERALVTVLNPFAEEASFDVIIRTEQRDVRPKSLSPFVLRGQRSVAIRVNDHVLKGPGERTVAVLVLPRIGRVVAGGLVVSGETLRAEGGLSFPRARAILPSAGYSGPGELLLMNPSATPADFLVVSEGATAQRAVAGPAGVSMGPQRVRTLDVDGLAEAGVVVVGTDDAPVAAAMRLAGQGDLATIAGTPRGVRSWLVLPTLPPNGGRSFLVLENSGREPATATVRLVGPFGTVATTGLESILVPAGRTIKVTMPTSVEATPLSAIVTVTGGTLAASGASYSRDGSGYAATLGIPMKE
jgi:hypothetical protein